MYSDKMLEFIILADMLEEYADKGLLDVLGKKYDVDKMCERLDELSREFLEPYAIKSDSKE